MLHRHYRWLLPRYGGYSILNGEDRQDHRVASPLWGLFCNGLKNPVTPFSCFPVMGVIPRVPPKNYQLSLVASPLWGLFRLEAHGDAWLKKLLPRYGGYSKVVDLALYDGTGLLPRYGGYSI